MIANPRRFLPFLALVLGAVGLAPLSARAAGDSRVRLEVLVDGRVAPEYRHDDSTYIEAFRGREYSVRVSNLEPYRVAVAVSVDGRNVIDARRSTALEARKWILQPYESIVLDGWQVSGSRARRFFFTTEERSYAQWLGDASNAGVIEAVAFRERQPSWWSSYRPRVNEAPRRPAPPSDPWYSGRDSARKESEQASRSQPAPAPDHAPPAPAGSGVEGGVVGGVVGGSLGAELGARGDSSASASQAPQKMERRERDDQASDEAAATGIGRDVSHEIVTVEFEHESRPSGTARLRYGYRTELVQLGVLPPPRPWQPYDRRESARGFEPGPFCPSPR